MPLRERQRCEDDTFFDRCPVHRCRHHKLSQAPFQIIDGQHRVLGMKRLSGEEKVPVVFLLFDKPEVTELVDDEPLVIKPTIRGTDAPVQAEIFEKMNNEGANLDTLHSLWIKSEDILGMSITLIPCYRASKPIITQSETHHRSSMFSGCLKLYFWESQMHSRVSVKVQPSLLANPWTNSWISRRPVGWTLQSRAILTLGCSRTNTNPWTNSWIFFVLPTSGS